MFLWFFLSNTFFNQPKEEEFDLYKIENQSFTKLDSTDLEHGKASIHDTLAVIIGNDTIKIDPQKQYDQPK